MDTSIPTQITITSLNLQTMLVIAAFFGAAVLISLFGGLLARRMVSLSRFAPEKRRPSKERTRTLQSLLSSGITFLAFVLAVLASLSCLFQFLP